MLGLWLWLGAHHHVAYHYQPSLCFARVSGAYKCEWWFLNVCFPPRFVEQIYQYLLLVSCKIWPKNYPVTCIFLFYQFVVSYTKAPVSLTGIYIELIDFLLLCNWGKSCFVIFVLQTHFWGKAICVCRPKHICFLKENIDVSSPVANSLPFLSVPVRPIGFVRYCSAILFPTIQDL